MRITALITSLLVLLCTTSAAAQLSSLEPGDRGRLQLDSKEQLTGEFVSATDDSLTLRIHADATATTLPITAVRSLEVSRGTPSAWRSALNAAVIGAGLPGSQLVPGQGADGVELGKHAGWGAGLGGVAGFALGAIIREERWSALPLPHRPAGDAADRLRFPALAIAGRWGVVGGLAGEGTGGGARVSAALTRLGDNTHLRAEASFERSTLESGPVARSEELGAIASHEAIRRYNLGLTVVENLWSLGDRVQPYFTFGLGVSRSRVSGAVRSACGPAYPCNVGGVAYGYDSTRNHQGTYAIGGFGVAVRVHAVNTFAEIRYQMIDDGAYEPGRFVPLSLGLSF